MNVALLEFELVGLLEENRALLQMTGAILELSSPRLEQNSALLQMNGAHWDTRRHPTRRSLCTGSNLAWRFVVRPWRQTTKKNVTATSAKEQIPRYSHELSRPTCESSKNFSMDF